MLNITEDFKWDEYNRYFNAGYIIGKYAPELSELIDSLKSDNFKFDAIKDGIGEWQLELEHSPEFKDRMPTWLKEDPFIRKDIEPEIDKDFDIEPEI